MHPSMGDPLIIEGFFHVVLHSCWGVWRDARRDGKMERERGRQKELAAKALLSMVGDQDFLLSHTCLSAWKEELVHVRRAREQEESELRLHAEVRRYREKKEATLLDCMAKLGSESGAMLTRALMLKS